MYALRICCRSVKNVTVRLKAKLHFCLFRLLRKGYVCFLVLSSFLSFCFCICVKGQLQLELPITMQVAGSSELYKSANGALYFI